MSEIPFFTVLVPLYNKEKNISSTIQSVLDQTCNDFELLIINDGSTDNSLKVVESFSDPRIRIIDKENQGVSSARNTGIKAAKSEYIAFLDADDLWEPKFLELMQILINDFPKASLYNSQFYIKTNENHEIANPEHSHRGYINNYFKEQLKSPIIISSNLIVKKECFEKVGYFNTTYKRGEDLEMWVRLTKNFDIAFEPTPIATYVLDAEERACNRTPPLKDFYVEYNIFRRPKYEKSYYIYLAKIVFNELVRNKRYKEAFLLVRKLGAFSGIFIFHIFVDFYKRLLKKYT